MIKTIIFIFLFISFTDAMCPNIITRSQWGAVSAISSSLRVNPPTHVVIHHSESPTCTKLADCSAIVRSMQKKHIIHSKYPDIAYNFVVAEDGNVYEGVGWSKEGTHEGRLDSRSLGICIIGDYTSTLPNDAALNSLKRLLECGIELGYLDPNYKLMAHNQLRKTQCPGIKMYYHIRDWNNWSAAP